MRHPKASVGYENWWALWPDLLREELEAFSKRGIAPRTLYQAHGILILEAEWPVHGHSDPIRLRIGFSPLHPYFRPAVGAPDEKFERHQNPLTKELCLLTQETGQWNPRQLVSDFIEERLKQLLAALDARKEKRWDDAARLEEQAPDPLMPYFAGAEDDSVILFDGSMPVPPNGHGLMDVVCMSRNSARNQAAFEGILRQVKNSSGVGVGKRFAFPNEPAGAQVVTARWVKFTPPAAMDAAELLLLAEKELETQAVLQGPSVRKLNQFAAGPFSITGIVFPDEIEYGQQKKGAGWLFLASRRGLVTGNEQNPAETQLIIGKRAGKDDIFSRLPVARSLLNKSVVVVGCGAIGGFAALELARAGVGRVAFVDYDTVEPGNSLRWPLGRTAWGSPKAVALANFVLANYPWTTPTAFGANLGAATSAPDTLPPDLNENVLSPILDVLREANLVVDTSASFEVQYALSYYCRRLKVPYVMGYATVGLAGGVVARFVHDSKSCLVCLHEHWKDEKHISKPRLDNTGMVTPLGCNAPTFTGGGFDLQEVSLEVVRSAVGLLSEGKYDPGTWQVSILTLQGENGVRVLPSWEAFHCPPHPRCCGAGE
ncbi:ThiF family adenylyltransferase [Bradyrhizobium yuanmingense]|uniref:ThiF family adenylyltransferase n=1 Tax=Bradyrhizobium yuanmingense TaxID=108015 RepID=UPI0011A2D36A|nr:ThiF family adenylyltransferase [Bradyrhizobium yuanmingense]